MTNSSGFRTALAQYIRSQARPPDKFSHQPRLYRLAHSLGEPGTFDDDVLYAAAWLHDLGVFIGHRPSDAAQLASWDHIAYVVEKAPPLLRSFNFPEGKIEPVLDAVRCHMPCHDPHTREGILLRDADILEQLGAIGILRIVSKVGRDTRFVTFADAVRVLRKSAVELPALILLPETRRLAEPRLAVLHAFLDAVEAERGPIPL